eukprot:gene21311-biopygen16347
MEDTGEDKKMEEESCTDVQEESTHGIERMDIGKEVVPGSTHIEYHAPVIYIASGEAPITIGNIEQGTTHTFDRVRTVLENAPGNSEVTTGSATFASSSLQDVNGDKEAVLNKPQSANAFSGLREKYRKDCSRHEVNCVDAMENCIISLDLDINDFSVNLKIVEEEKICTAKDQTYHDELEKHLHSLKDNAKAIKVGELMNMIEDKEKERIMFVSGLAGIGKSVLAKKVALDWACKECSQTRCLFYITCRKLNSFFHKSDSDIEPVTFIEEYLKKEFRNMPFDNVETTVFLIDGLDELQEPVKIMKAFTEKFSKSRFIFLGRPHARHYVNSIGQKSQKLEILGLNDGQIEEYIKKFPKLSTDKRSIIFKKTELECKDEKFIEGFLVGVKNRAGDITKYMFKHLTIMEFLASIHVYFAENKSKLFEELSKKERHEIISFVCSFVRFSLIKETSFEEDDEISYQLVEKLAEGKEVAKNRGDGVITYEDAKSVIRNILNQLRNYKVLLKVRFLADCFVASDKVRDVKLLEELLKSIKPNSNVGVYPNAFDQSSLLSILKLATGNEMAYSEIKNAFSGIEFRIYDLREMEILEYALWIDIDLVQLNDVNHFTEHQLMLVHRNVAFCESVWFDNCKVPLFTTNANESTTRMKLKRLGMEGMKIDESDVSSAANLFCLAEKVGLHHVRVGGNEFEKIVEKLIQIKPRRLMEMELYECPLVNVELKQKMEENGVTIFEDRPRSILILCEPESRDFVLQLKENLDDIKHYIAMDEDIEEFERRYDELPHILVVFIQHQIPEDVERDIIFARRRQLAILFVKLEADFHPSKALSSVFDSNPCLDFTDKRNNAAMASELNRKIPAITDKKFIVISNAPGNQYRRPKIIALKLDNDFQPGDELNKILRESTCICWTDKTNFDTNFAKVKEEINARFA